MWGSPQLIDNFVYIYIVISIDHYRNIYVVMSWDVLSVGVSTAD